MSSKAAAQVDVYYPRHVVAGYLVMGVGLMCVMLRTAGVHAAAAARQPAAPSRAPSDPARGEGSNLAEQVPSGE